MKTRCHIHMLSVIAVLACFVASAQDKIITTLPNQSIFVHDVKRLAGMEDGMTVHWGQRPYRLLVSKPGANKFYNVYSISPDGFRMRQLTLSREWSTSRQHKGGASWHPDGAYFVFISQNMGSASYESSLPDVGLNCNLWVGTEDGAGPWRLTNIPTNSPPRMGVLSPYFSPDGKRLFWSGNTGKHPAGSAMGQRALFLADFVSDGVAPPRLENTQTLLPGKQRDFYESHGFSPDGNHLLFSGNLEEGQSLLGLDIYTYDLRNSTVRNLTKQPEVWNKFAAFSPDGKKVVWTSSANLAVRFFGGGESKWKSYLRSELWISDADGSNPKRLTFFNTPGWSKYVPRNRRCFVADCAWDPMGNRIAISLYREALNRALESSVMLLELGEGPPPEEPDTSAPARPERGGFMPQRMVPGPPAPPQD